jgi:hypothetical protein
MMLQKGNINTPCVSFQHVQYMHMLKTNAEVYCLYLHYNNII